MTLRHREQHPILRELRMRQLLVPRRHAGSKADIQSARQHGLNLMNRKLMMHHELHVRLTTAEFAERLRNHSVPRDSGRDSDSKRPRFAKGDPLGAKFKAGIAKLYANGTMKRILAKWGVSQFALKS